MTAAKGQLHPSVQKFKEFVRNHPKMISEVRNGTKTWQQFYEEWYLLGEHDVTWDSYKEEGARQPAAAAAQSHSGEDKGIVGKMMTFIKAIDMNELQNHLTSVTNAIGSVQQAIQQFKGTTPQQTQETVKEEQSQNNPFFFQKD